MQLVIRTAAELEAEARSRDTARARAEAQAYLASTDWLVTRFSETGTPIPEEARERCKAARQVLTLAREP